MVLVWFTERVKGIDQGEKQQDNGSDHADAQALLGGYQIVGYGIVAGQEKQEEVDQSAGRDFDGPDLDFFKESFIHKFCFLGEHGRR
jgi:hypothetical protein